MSYSFPPYSGDQGRCIKCGHEGALTTHKQVPEHLERECEYSWMESVLTPCTCGEPTAGVKHRSDGPCYLHVPGQREGEEER